MSKSVEYLTRTGCSLCGQFEPSVHQTAAVLGMQVRVVDIDERPDLRAEYHTRVPVIRLLGGRVLTEGHLTVGKVTRAMLAARFLRDGSSSKKPRNPSSGDSR